MEFGLAPPSGISSLNEAAMGMPIQVFIGKNRQPHLMADSSRLANANSVLVLKKFLDWANEKYGQPVSADFYFLEKWIIEGAPLSKEQLLEMSGKRISKPGKYLHLAAPLIDHLFLPYLK